MPSKDKYKRSIVRRRWYENHKEEQRKLGREYYQKNRSKMVAKHTLWRLRNREKLLALQRAWYIKNKERLQPIRKQYNIWRREHGYTKEYFRKVRLEVLSHYGGIPPKCACCEEKHLEFLVIDHVGGGGNKHRKQLRRSSLWTWFKANKYPQGYRVLCHNCNASLGYYRYCPHKHG